MITIRPSCIYLRATGLLAVFATLCTSVPASVPLGAKDNIQIGGFFSQGWIASYDNNYPFKAKGGTWDFREMAVNISTTVGSRFRFGAQGFAQRLGNYGEDKVLLDWAVADYNFRPEFGIRAGRIKYPKGLYGEALDLDVVRPFVFLPMSLYNPILRDYNSSFDGAMLYGTLQAGRTGSVDYKLFYGNIPMNTDQGVADYFNNASLFKAPGVQQLELDYTGGVALDWSTPVSGLKLHLSASRLGGLHSSGLFAPVPFALPITLALPRMNYGTVGLEYVRDDWTFAAEFQRTDGDTAVNAPPVIIDSRGKYGIDNYYVSAARRLGGRYEVGGYYSVSRNRFAAPTASRQDKELHDYALSLRCDVNEHVTVKLEGHYIDGRYNLFNTTRTPNPTKAGHSSFVASKATFSF